MFKVHLWNPVPCPDAKSGLEFGTRGIEEDELPPRGFLLHFPRSPTPSFSPPPHFLAEFLASLGTCSRRHQPEPALETSCRDKSRNIQTLGFVKPKKKKAAGAEEARCLARCSLPMCGKMKMCCHGYSALKENMQIKLEPKVHPTR